MSKTEKPVAAVELAFPLQTPAGPVTRIRFRRGKTRDMMAAQRAEADIARRELVLMAMLSEEKLTVEDLEEMDLADLAEVQSTFQSLFVRPAGGG